MGLGDTSGTHYRHVRHPAGDGMRILFPNGVTMVLRQQGWRGACGVRYEGDEGWVSVADGYSQPDVSNPAWLADFKRLTREYALRTGRSLDHVRNFLDCVRSRELTVANEVVMHRSMSTVHAANICMWLGRDVVYDPVREAFVRDPEADRLHARAPRPLWAI